jgi:hypothetical protein
MNGLFTERKEKRQVKRKVTKRYRRKEIKGTVCHVRNKLVTSVIKL